MGGLQMMNQQQHRALDCMEDQVQQLPHPGPLLGPQRRQPGLTGAAYPWAGMPHPPVTPQMQQAWNATQEPAAHNVSASKSVICVTNLQCSTAVPLLYISSA